MPDDNIGGLHTKVTVSPVRSHHTSPSTSLWGSKVQIKTNNNPLVDQRHTNNPEEKKEKKLTFSPTA
jgi:hypothetical protein